MLAGTEGCKAVTSLRCARHKQEVLASAVVVDKEWRRPLSEQPNVFTHTPSFLSSLAVLALLPAASSAQNFSDVQPAPGPLVLKQQGSFFVGGKQVFSDAAGWDLAGALTQYGSGDITVNQMYVQFQIPQNEKHTPIVFVHGCCLSSKTWETTPDGRMGWYEYFTRQGFPTYLGEQSGRARSGFDGTRFNEDEEGGRSRRSAAGPDGHG